MSVVAVLFGLAAVASAIGILGVIGLAFIVGGAFGEVGLFIGSIVAMVAIVGLGGSAIVGAITARGLWRGRPWARVLAIALASLAALGGISGIASREIVLGAQFLVSAAVVVYLLLPSARAYFIS